MLIKPRKARSENEDLNSKKDLSVRWKFVIDAYGKGLNIPDLNASLIASGYEKLTTEECLFYSKDFKGTSEDTSLPSIQMFCINEHAFNIITAFDINPESFIFHAMIISFFGFIFLSTEKVCVPEKFLTGLFIYFAFVLLIWAIKQLIVLFYVYSDSNRLAYFKTLNLYKSKVKFKIYLNQVKDFKSRQTQSQSPTQSKENTIYSESSTGISRARIIDRGYANKANIAKVNEVLMKFKCKRLNPYESLTYISVVDSASVAPSLEHFGLDKDKKDIIEAEKIYYIIFEILLSYTLYKALLSLGVKSAFSTINIFTVIILPFICMPAIKNFLRKIKHIIKDFPGVEILTLIAVSAVITKSYLPTPVNFLTIIFAYSILVEFLYTLLHLKDGNNIYNLKTNYNLYKKVSLIYGQKMAALREARAKEEQLTRKRSGAYWYSLDGHTFEKEIGELFAQLGYGVTVTKGSGDGGVDIILNGNGVISIVQCKAYRNPVPPEPVRALWGVKDDFGADEVILIALSGVTKMGQEFIDARRDQYKLYTIEDVINMTMEASNSYAGMS